jgi:putative flippase GtrA
LLAYGIAKPVMHWILNGYSVTFQENISMALGMCLFVLFNYIGQRYFAFKKSTSL